MFFQWFCCKGIFWKWYFFSDFADTSRPQVAKKSNPPAPPPFPLPSRSIHEMSRNQLGSYAKNLVDYVCLPGQKRGEGRCQPWEQEVSAGILSLKSRRLLKLEPGDVISLSMIREWNSLRFKGGFKEGPGRADTLWLKKMSWSSFLLVIIEVLMAVFGKHSVPEGSRPQPPLQLCPPPSTSSVESSLPTCPPTPCAPYPRSSRPPCPTLRPTSPPSSSTVQIGSGPISRCLREWFLNHHDKTLSSLPLDVSHPPRLRVSSF